MIAHPGGAARWGINHPTHALVSGLMPIEEFIAMFRVRGEGQDLDVDTVGDFVMNNLGRASREEEREPH